MLILMHPVSTLDDILHYKLFLVSYMNLILFVVGVQSRPYVKREENPMYLQGASPFEIKLNIIDSEVVLLEDTTQWDSNAVIFKVK